MSEVRRKGPRGKKRGRSKNKEFMDAALDAFIRDQALQKWHEVDGLRSGAKLEAAQAVAASNEFLAKGAYRDLWRDWWRQEVLETEPGTDEVLFGQIEKAVRGAVLEEREARRQEQDALLEDSFVYKEFIARQMDHLLFEAAGDIEEDI
ncbi:MAG: hypothetical protein VX610_06840 [SAR324 cluster bacterium]|nr:hypothetical protein [SAR324 cluster bacterium]